jgi:hypothetical protein
MTPEALVLRRVESFWEDDDVWYSGTLIAHSPALNAYDLLYDDGDVDEAITWPSPHLRLAGPGKKIKNKK